MVLLGYATSAASAAGSYAFSAATNYVFRPDASTSSASSAPPTGGNKTDPLPHHRGRREPLSPSAAANGAFPSSSSSSSHNKRLSLHLPSSSQHPRPNRLPSPSPSPSPPSPSPSSTPPKEPSRGEAEDLVDLLNAEEDLYKILGVGRRAKTEEIRRGFLARSRVIHPDKLPLYPLSTTAFQRLSYAYETLSKPGSRRMYDLGGGRGYDAGSPSAGPTGSGDETLNGVLRSMINEFLNGDFEMIRVFVTALNEGNPSLNLGDEAVDNLEGAFRRVRETLLAGHRSLLHLLPSLHRLSEIQHSLRSLSYFDIYGRLRLTLELTRVAVEIPLVVDRGWREEGVAGAGSSGVGAGGRRRKRRRAVGEEEREEEEEEGDEPYPFAPRDDAQLERRGLLGTRTRGMLVLTCRMLEKAERWAGS